MIYSSNQVSFEDKITSRETHESEMMEELGLLVLLSEVPTGSKW